MYWCSVNTCRVCLSVCCRLQWRQLWEWSVLIKVTGFTFFGYYIFCQSNNSTGNLSSKQHITSVTKSRLKIKLLVLTICRKRKRENNPFSVFLQIKVSCSLKSFLKGITLNIFDNFGLYFVGYCTFVHNVVVAFQTLMNAWENRALMEGPVSIVSMV